VIVILAVVGLLPLLIDATVSGLVVMGLAPPVILLLFTSGYRPLTFHLPFWWCALVGTLVGQSCPSLCQHRVHGQGRCDNVSADACRAICSAGPLHQQLLPLNFNQVMWWCALGFRRCSWCC